MLRKSIMFLSLVSITALIAWGFVPGGSTPARASAMPATIQCNIQYTVNTPVFIGTPQNPQSVSASWNITLLPAGSRITGTQIQYIISRNNAPAIIRLVNIPGNTSSHTLNLAFLGSNLPVGQRPNFIVTEVKVTATGSGSTKTCGESNTLAL